MRIVIIGPVYPYRGGVAHHVTSLFRALSDSQEVRVISFKRQYPAFLYPGSSDKDPSQDVIKVKADFILDLINPITWFRTRNEILRWQPDIVLFNWWVPYWSLAFGLMGRSIQKRGIPIVFIDHNVLPHEQHWWDIPLTKFTLRLGDLHVVHTLAQKELLRSISSKGKILLSPLPIYDAIQLEKIPQKIARTNLNLPGEGFLFLFFGFVRKYKGLHVLLEAMSILKNRGYFPNLIVAGEFWDDKDDYLDRIKMFELASQVSIFDEYIRNEDLSNHFSAANAYVAPYTGGSQSGQLTLALNFGLPSISTEAIASAINYLHHDSLIIIPKDDSNALANAMMSLIDNPHHQFKFSSSEMGNWSRLADEIIAHFDQPLRSS